VNNTPNVNNWPKSLSLFTTIL